MNSRCLNDIKAEALRLGFFSCGVSRAARVAEEDIEAYLATMRDGGFASMTYMTENLEKRFDPTLLVPNAKSIISVALNYTPQQRIPSDRYQIATYAYGRDYHDVMRGMLHKLATQLGLVNPISSPSLGEGLGVGNYRAFCDTAPVLERYWAVQAGIGWIGRNHQLIVPGAGSRVFLGEIITTEELPVSTERHAPRCGDCTACINACPTRAINPQPTTYNQQPTTNIVVRLNPQACLSYLTIENRGDIPSEAAEKMGHCFYGCDRCTDACPWNKNAEPTQIAAFQPSQELLQMTDDDWHNLTDDDYRRLFKGSAVKRAKYEGIKRNINAIDCCPTLKELRI